MFVKLTVLSNKCKVLMRVSRIKEVWQHEGEPVFIVLQLGLWRSSGVYVAESLDEVLRQLPGRGRTCETEKR